MLIKRKYHPRINVRLSASLVGILLRQYVACSGLLADCAVVATSYNGENAFYLSLLFL